MWIRLHEHALNASWPITTTSWLTRLRRYTVERENTVRTRRFRRPSSSTNSEWSACPSSGQYCLIEIVANRAATVFATPLAASTFDQYAAHRLGGRREKMAAAIPLNFLLLSRRLRRTNQAQVCFMNQSRCGERLARGFPGKPMGCQPAELIINQG